MTMIRSGRTRLDVLDRAVARVQASVAATAAPWYSIRNAAGAGDTPASLDIYGEIGFFGVSAAQFAQDIGAITAKKIDMRVSSPGGDVFDAVAIYNIIRSHPAYVTARVDGLAASAASLIVQAADRRVMMPHSQMMIHKAWGMTIGNADDHAETVDLLNRQDEVIAGIYHDRTRGGTKKLAKIKDAMAAETWFTDEEAVAFGLADTVERPSWQAGPGEDDTGDQPAPDQEPDPADPAESDDTTQEDAMATLRRELAELEAADDLEALLG